MKTPQLPERLVLCVDTHPELRHTDIRPTRGAARPRLDVLRDALSVMLALRAQQPTRLGMRAVDTTALVTLGATAQWHTDFTSDVGKLNAALASVQVSDEAPDPLDMDSLFTLLAEKAAPDDDTVTRAVVVYSRSIDAPTLASGPSYRALQQHSNFFLDVVYVHERPSGSNAPQQVFDRLTAHEGGAATPSFVFEHSANARRLAFSIAQLAAHPSVRGDQASYRTHLHQASAA